MLSYLNHFIGNKNFKNIDSTPDLSLVKSLLDLSKFILVNPNNISIKHLTPWYSSSSPDLSLYDDSIHTF